MVIGVRPVDVTWPHVLQQPGASDAAKLPFYAYIPAKDVARARRFCEGKLGFRPKQEGAGVVYEFGEKTACFLYPTPTLAPRWQAKRSGRSTTSSARWLS